MNGFLYANSERVGDWEIFAFDAGMGVVLARFYPHDAYKRIQPVIQELSALGSLAEHTEEQQRNVWVKLDALRLTAKTITGDPIELAGGIVMYDYSEELREYPEEHSYELHLIGVSRQLAEKYDLDNFDGFYGRQSS